MRSNTNDIPIWLASLSDRALRRLNSRLAYLSRLVDIEIHRREIVKHISKHQQNSITGETPSWKIKIKTSNS